MKRKIRVMCIQPDPNDATSFYRGMGPVAYMSKFENEFDFMPIPKGISVTWSLLQQADVLFIQRPFSADHLQIVDMAKDNGLKVWVDYDDDIFNIPIHNHVRLIYEKKNAKKHAEACLQIADLITVSTKELWNLFGGKDKVHIVPNAINTDLFPLSPKTKSTNTVMWRGSKTHEVDVFEVHDDLVRLASEFREWKFNFIGEHHWRTVDRLSGFTNVNFYEAKDVIQYHRALKKMNPDVNLVPLQNIPFNKSKSMCSWLEATYAGGVTVGPDFEEWQRPGVYNYKDGDFYSTASKIMSKPNERAEAHERAVEYINENLSLSVTAEQRFVLLQSIL